MGAEGPWDELAWKELRAALHEEVHRLPEKYRLPVILCYLEGQTHEEAARRLEWPLGTVKGRLARARDLLQARLGRRELAIPATVCVEALSRDRVVVPDALAQATVEAALRFAAGESGVIPGRVTAWAEAALGRRRLGEVLSDAVSLGVGVLAPRRRGEEQSS